MLRPSSLTRLARAACPNSTRTPGAHETGNSSAMRGTLPSAESAPRPKIPRGSPLAWILECRPDGAGAAAEAWRDEWRGGGGAGAAESGGRGLHPRLPERGGGPGAQPPDAAGLRRKPGAVLRLQGRGGRDRGVDPPAVRGPGRRRAGGARRGGGALRGGLPDAPVAARPVGRRWCLISV